MANFFLGKNMERAGVGVKRSLTSLRNVLSEKDGSVSVAAARECFRDFKSELELLDDAKKDANSSKTCSLGCSFLRNEFSSGSLSK
ncbi:hypothetical protein COOONC_17377 [Cooperia oncophora]